MTKKLESMTLQQIQEMNIKPGDPIEMLIKFPKSDKTYPQIGYFKEIVKDRGEGKDYEEGMSVLIYETGILNTGVQYLKNIHEIRPLQYKPLK